MRVILADDHAMFRNSLRMLLESEDIHIVGEASDGYAALKLARQEDPDAVVLDMNMPLMNGIEVTREIVKRKLNAKTVILTMFEDEASILEAFRAGVRGYILKTQAATDLKLALVELQQGKLYLSPAIADTVVDAYLRHEEHADDAKLTARERQILQLVAEGNATKKIARLLSLTVKTVESHRNRIMKKLNTGNIAGLVRHAVRQGIIRP